MVNEFAAIFEPFKFTPVNSELVLILISLLIGLIIGTGREYQNKSVALGTFVLVSFGALIYTILSIKIDEQNPDRIGSNIKYGR